MKNVARLFRFLKPRTSRGRVLLWATLFSLIFGAIGAGHPLEEYLRSQRNRLHRHPASGEIVLIAIDNRSTQEFGRYPWSSKRFADLVTQLDSLGAEKIFLGNQLTAKSENADDDQILAEAFRKLDGKVILPVAVAVGATERTTVDLRPLAAFRPYVELASINVMMTPFGTVRRLPYHEMIDGQAYPSIASLMAAAPGTGDFRIDYSIDPKTVPTISAADILDKRVGPRSLVGKRVIIGSTFVPYTDAFYEPSYGDFPGTYIHIFGAETLLQGRPFLLQWWWPFLASLLLCVSCLAIRHERFRFSVIGSGLVAAVALPLPLEMHRIFADVTAAIALLVVVAAGFAWCRYRERYQAKGLTNEVSGLPNLNALNHEPGDAELTLIAARVHNYAAIVATLDTDGERELVQQIAKRLMVGASDSRLFQGDEGIFAWFGQAQMGRSSGAHLDALHSLFRTPIVVEGRQFDLVISFGFDAFSDRLVGNRFATALLAADEAHKEGLRWKEHDPSRLADSSWKLSLLSQLDAAIDSGDVWIAYQPKLDLTTNRIIGAEALARWTHSEKGAINPVEFILAAEQSNRIEKLTHYVLEHAIRAAAAINKHGIEYNVSVNISARLLEDETLVTATRKLLTRHGLVAEHLTLEVTETAAIGNAARSLATLRQLRDMGIRLSVDDYGTGMSTLDYLQRIPACEIKIDRSFVVGMQANHATKVMVNSTIQLAHSLGQKVVAEGVEDEETLDELRRMGCDIAQGYLIGKPMTFRALSKALAINGREHAA